MISKLDLRGIDEHAQGMIKLCQGVVSLLRQRSKIPSPRGGQFRPAEGGQFDRFFHSKKYDVDSATKGN